MDKRGYYIMQFVFVIIFLLIYGLLNYYIGIRGYRSISAQIPLSRWIYWSVYAICALAYIVGMAGRNFLPESIGRLLSTIGGYWIAAFVYLLGLVVIIDIFSFIGKRLNLIPAVIKNNSWFLAFAVIAGVGILLAVGTYNAMVPKITKYDIAIDKKAGNLKKLKVAMISDIHLGDIIGRDRLKNAVELINSLEPDLVVITGDLFDSAIEPVKKENMLAELKGIKARYGAYAIMGNHEYFSNSIDEISKMIEENGVTVLRDRATMVDGSFYLVGREDKTGARLGISRSTLDGLLRSADKSLPIIVLDHQPSGLEEPRKAGVDLQLSGHTHAGQFFPASIVTNIIFEKDYGYLQDENFNLIVSSGYGTWGPTVRIGSQSEVVEINISFGDNIED